MFRILQSLLIVALLIVVIPATHSNAFAQNHPHDSGHHNDVAQELHDLLDRFLAGASTNDVEMHDRFWTEDLIYTSSAGQRFGKAEIMAGLTEPPPDDIDPPVYSSENVAIRIFGDIAVITFRLVAADPAGNRSAEFFNTGVFERRDGQWKAFTWQATRIPETAE